LLPHSYEPASCPCPEPVQSSPCLPIYTEVFQVVSFPQAFPPRHQPARSLNSVRPNSSMKDWTCLHSFYSELFCWCSLRLILLMSWGIGEERTNRWHRYRCIFTISLISPCFAHHYAHRQENRLYKTMCGVSLDVLAAVVWSWDTSWAHQHSHSVFSWCPGSTQLQPAHPG